LWQFVKGIREQAAGSKTAQPRRKQQRKRRGTPVIFLSRNFRG